MKICTRSSLWTFGASALVLASGCMGRSVGDENDPISEDDSQPASGGESASPSANATLPSNPGPRQELAGCAASPERAIDWHADGELRELIVGAWAFCPGYENDSSAPVLPGVVGIEFADSLTYSLLLVDERGAWVRGRGIDYNGDWYPGTDGMSPEITLVIPWSDTSASLYRPVFTENPRQMRVEEGWAFFNSVRYVPVALEE